MQINDKLQVKKILIYIFSENGKSEKKVEDENRLSPKTLDSRKIISHFDSLEQRHFSKTF